MTQQRAFLAAALAAFTIVETAARADIIFDQPPSPGYAAASDTDYIALHGPDAGQHIWMRIADDFAFSTPQTIRQITWWGCYGGDDFPTHPPIGDDYMRIRIYDPRPEDELPGNILYEQTLINPSRVATGNIIDIPGDPPEYRYQSDLATPFVAEAGSTYWLEIAQLGISDSLFRWETTDTGSENDSTSINDIYLDWTPSPGIAFAFQLSDTPEPHAIVLLGLGFLAIARIRRAGGPK